MIAQSTLISYHTEAFVKTEVACTVADLITINTVALFLSPGRKSQKVLSKHTRISFLDASYLSKYKPEKYTLYLK